MEPTPEPQLPSNEENEPVSLTWVVARVLFFISIIIVALWFAFGSDGQKPLRLKLQTYGRDMQRSEGRRWAKAMGESQALKVMTNAAQLIQSQLYTSPETPRKTVRMVTLAMEDKISVPAVTIRNTIHISRNHIENFPGDASLEMEALIYKTMAYVWLWDGEGRAPRELLDTMADFLTVSSVHATAVDEPVDWITRDEKQYNNISVRFLQFCEASKPGFLSGLNAKLASGWNESFIQDLMGTSMDDLRAAYEGWQTDALVSFSS